MTNATVSDSVADIGDYAFYDCMHLTSVTLGNGVTSIGDWAFSQCSSLTNSTISSSVTNIGKGAFSYCDGLTAIAVDVNNPFYTSVDGVLFNYSLTTLLQYPGGKAGAYTVPNSVTNIGDQAFASCGLTSVAIPDNVISIGYNAFTYDTGLTNVAIGNSVVSMGDWAFRFCINLSSIIIPNSVTSIGDYAFDHCASLTNVTMGNGLTTIGASAFESCINLTSVTIPNGLTTIGTGDFSYCSSLMSVRIGSGVTNIGQEAFCDCTNLTSISIPDAVANIGNGAFSECTRLTSITIGRGVTNIQNAAFNSCPSLTGVYFKGNAPIVDAYGWFVFAYDFNAIVYYLPGTTGWSSSFASRPTVLWTLPQPLVLQGSVGVQSNQFGFTVSWATNLSVVVEASTDLAGKAWTPIQTNALNNGVVNFTDPEWTNYPARFYRVRSQ